MTKGYESPSIALIGGGTGSFTLLQELKHASEDLSAIVNMSDDGGSTGKLRDEFDVMPPGDLRQCLVALSNDEDVKELFDYRFGGEGSLAGQSLGNLVLSGLELQTTSIEKAIKIASRILDITGEVIPVTKVNHRLMMEDEDGITEGELNVVNKKVAGESPKLWLEPRAPLSEIARRAITRADVVVVAPGHFYGSIIPALAVNGMQEALRESKAKKLMVTNLINKPGQNDNWHVVDYVKKAEEYTGSLDVVLYNSTPPSCEQLNRYAQKGELPVLVDQGRFSESNVNPIGAELLDRNQYKQCPNDTMILRTLIRHDGKKVTSEIKKLLYP